MNKTENFIFFDETQRAKCLHEFHSVLRSEQQLSNEGCFLIEEFVLSLSLYIHFKYKMNHIVRVYHH
jgi:hypothetical protein